MTEKKDSDVEVVVASIRGMVETVRDLSNRAVHQARTIQQQDARIRRLEREAFGKAPGSFPVLETKSNAPRKN